MIERERKYRMPPEAVDPLRGRLAREGRPVRAGIERDVFFDHPAIGLSQDDRRLRLRMRAEDGMQELTYKSPRRIVGVDKVRAELTAVVAAGPVEPLLAELGFRPVTTVLKRREVYVLGDAEVTLDHLEAHGWFCEVEALQPGADLDQIAFALGLTPRQLEPRTYPEIVGERPGEAVPNASDGVGA